MVWRSLRWKTRVEWGSPREGFDQGRERRRRASRRKARRRARARATKSGARFLRRRQRRTARFGRGMRRRRAGAPGTGIHRMVHAGRNRFSVAGLSSSPLFMAVVRVGTATAGAGPAFGQAISHPRRVHSSFNYPMLCSLPIA